MLFTGKEEYEYSYDSLNRIVGEKVTGIISYSRTYAYDSEGNISRVTQDGEEERYEYSQGRLTRVKVNGTIKKQYSYDEYGNPTDYAGEATLFLLMTKRRASRHTSPLCSCSAMKRMRSKRKPKNNYRVKTAIFNINYMRKERICAPFFDN